MRNVTYMHRYIVTLRVREALLQQSLAGNKCYRAGERITEPDSQGEEGRAGNNRQSKNKRNKFTRDIVSMLRVILYANRVCSGNVTPPRKTNACGAFEGSPSATALRPDPADLISNPLEHFENICTG